jgi:hypothetical protein
LPTFFTGASRSVTLGFKVLRLLAAIQKEGWRTEVRRYNIHTDKNGPVR